MTGKKRVATTRKVVQRAFGEENRRRLLTEWFAANGQPTPADAWKHVYRLLLWIDRSTGLAHCYESDKSQPGRHWYGRSLAFHSWVSDQLQVGPSELGGQIDWLFRTAIAQLSAAVEARREKRLQQAVEQRADYSADLPEPGDDAELFEIIHEVLEPYLAAEVPDRVLRRLARRITAHLKRENKRKNLIGEGFEDVIGAMVGQLPNGSDYTIHRRIALDELPGFYPPRGKDKVKKVDLGLVHGPTSRRVLVSAKWSIRADREEQLATDFLEYERLESDGRRFEYVLVTNEFDPARLLAACTRRGGNKLLFDSVVHVNPRGVLTAYGGDPSGSAAEVVELVEDGRLSSLSDWLREFAPA